MEKNISYRPYYIVGGIFIFLFIFSLFFFTFFISAPADFKSAELIKIPSGTTVSDTAQILKQNSIVRSPFLFKVLVKIFGGDNGVIAGSYAFDKPISLFEVVNAMTTNGYGVKVFKITIPEGLNNRQIADLLEKNLDDFNKKEFLDLAKGKEGYLFPDTYFFEPDAKPESVIKKMSDNFNDKIKTIEKDIRSSNKNLKDLMIMASILEEEARTEETRKIVSGILWKRLAKSYPLQVDAVFGYLLGKASSEVTLDDLKLDSPYNTYKYRGLPPGPISNPGVDAILASIHPTETKYWFYLSDKEGNMHYAITFDEHKANKQEYLR